MASPPESGGGREPETWIVRLKNSRGYPGTLIFLSLLPVVWITRTDLGFLSALPLVSLVACGLRYSFPQSGKVIMRSSLLAFLLVLFAPLPARITYIIWAFDDMQRVIYFFLCPAFIVGATLTGIFAGFLLKGDQGTAKVRRYALALAVLGLCFAGQTLLYGTPWGLLSAQHKLNHYVSQQYGEELETDAVRFYGLRNAYVMKVHEPKNPANHGILLLQENSTVWDDYLFCTEKEMEKNLATVLRNALSERVNVEAPEFEVRVGIKIPQGKYQFASQYTPEMSVYAAINAPGTFNSEAEFSDGIELLNQVLQTLDFRFETLIWVGFVEGQSQAYVRIDQQGVRGPVGLSYRHAHEEYWVVAYSEGLGGRDWNRYTFSLPEEK